MNSSLEGHLNIQICQRIENKKDESKNDLSSINSQITTDNSQNISVNTLRKIKSNGINRSKTQVFFLKNKLFVKENLLPQKEKNSVELSNFPNNEKKEIKNKLEINERKEIGLNNRRNVTKENNLIKNDNVSKEKMEEIKIRNYVKNEPKKEKKNKMNSVYTQSYNKCDFKEKPPKVPALFDGDFSFSSGPFAGINEIKKIPNCFINHLLINDEKTKYCKISINKRNKGKMATLIYYRP